jgi:3-deoxy-D-manno-octulosonic-acid transferase
MFYFACSICRMTFLYRIAILIFYGLLLAASPFNHKARLWISGRFGWKAGLKAWCQQGGSIIWVHAASLGEFEQGRPLIDAIRQRHPEYRVLLTFYSPSGYEIRKNFPGADYVMYLPLDTPANARFFADHVKPVAALFIKYEYWYFFFKAMSQRDYPIYLISAIFRPSQAFFAWYGAWFRRKLGFVSYFFVQDEASANLLRGIGIDRCSVTGDTRFDRVNTVAAAAKDIPLASAFADGQFCLVAGSTWPEDEDILVDYIHTGPPHYKYIIAPHEVSPAGLNRLTSRLTCPVVLFSEATPETVDQFRVLVIDNMGMLSSLYRYGKAAYIGGGFGKGIHNILEAAAFGIPVIFGPNYSKFREALELIRRGGAFPVKRKEDLPAILAQLSIPESYAAACRTAGSYVADNTGATDVILNALFRKTN